MGVSYPDPRTFHGKFYFNPESLSLSVNSSAASSLISRGWIRVDDYFYFLFQTKHYSTNQLTISIILISQSSSVVGGVVSVSVSQS